MTEQETKKAEEEDFAKFLAEKVIKFAVYEYGKGVGNNDKQRNHYLSAKRFLVSEWFEDLCLLNGANSKYILEVLGIKC